MLKTINGGKMPTRGTEFSACVDLYANAGVVIGAGETVLIPLGVCIDQDNLLNILQKSDERITWNFKDLELWKSSHSLQLMLRSSLGKKGLIIPNGVGVIDMDYEDEICMIIHNPIKIKYQMDERNMNIDTVRTHLLGIGLARLTDVNINKGDRIAQIMICEHKSHLFGIESEVKRNGGFGSTGHI